MPTLDIYAYLWTFGRIAAFNLSEDSHVPRLEVLILVFTYLQTIIVRHLVAWNI